MPSADHTCANLAEKGLVGVGVARVASLGAVDLMVMLERHGTVVVSVVGACVAVADVPRLGGIAVGAGGNEGLELANVLSWDIKSHQLVQKFGESDNSFICFLSLSTPTTNPLNIIATR